MGPILYQIWPQSLLWYMLWFKSIFRNQIIIRWAIQVLRASSFDTWDIWNEHFNSPSVNVKYDSVCEEQGIFQKLGCLVKTDVNHIYEHVEKQGK